MNWRRYDEAFIMAVCILIVVGFWMEIAHPTAMLAAIFGGAFYKLYKMGMLTK